MSGNTCSEKKFVLTFHNFEKFIFFTFSFYITYYVFDLTYIFYHIRNYLTPISKDAATIVGYTQLKMKHSAVTKQWIWYQS